MTKQEEGIQMARKLLDACVMLSRGLAGSLRPSEPAIIRPKTDSNVSESRGLRFRFFLKPLGNPAV